VDGISATHGVTTFHYLEAEVTREMSARANRVIAVADQTKIGREGFAKIGGLTMVDTLVTNRSADKQAVAQVRGAGIEVIEV